ncbi:NAD(P)-dependent oxidoreductase [Microbacterium sp. UBA3394]|uniref:NAD(P)-dependent oxidoreductase n=1 Tax=Microbacterium sp. UBA3394 TaxID=1946945 RepID=UPI00257F7499|nr:NAD(P)-dependent oxidoreductase [Microbacterium sp. UBA3394]|tara:strand:- start:10541 stop:11431 length:891 start_codon:yes stop_codon:yes gene_type:complete
MSDLAAVALIGLGNMGLPIGGRWIAEGRTVTGFDLSDAAREAFAAEGGAVADDVVGAVAGADVIVLLLPDSRVVDAVLSSLLDSGAIADGAILVDMSSSEPEHTRRNAVAAAGRGIRFVDSPVSGGVRGAAEGRLTVMVGGDESTVTEIEPLLGALGTVVRVGEVGAGHAAKALNNLLSAIHFWATSEAVTAGERFGIDPGVLLRVINGSSGRSGSSEAKWPKFVLPETYDSGFSARLMLKDARIATTLMSGLGLPSGLGDELVGEWEVAVAELPPTADHTEIARWIREREGARAS